MSNGCCCCGTTAQTGGGVAAAAAMVGIGVFIYLNIVAIITFLLLAVAGIVGLTVLSVGGMLFLQRYMLHSSTRPDIAARLRHYANTGEVTSPSVVIEGEVIEDDGEEMEPALETGYQRRRKAISARAHEAAIAHSGVPIEHQDAEKASRPESMPVRDWLRRL